MLSLGPGGCVTGDKSYRVIWLHSRHSNRRTKLWTKLWKKIASGHQTGAVHTCTQVLRWPVPSCQSHLSSICQFPHLIRGLEEYPCVMVLSVWHKPRHTWAKATLVKELLPFDWPMAHPWGTFYWLLIDVERLSPLRMTASFNKWA